MHIPWDDLRLFLAVADAGSLSAASKRLGITQPTVSRRLAELEAMVGEPLFVRAAVGTTPTSFAERILEPARRMAEWAAEVNRTAERAETAPSGTVRITAPPGIAFDFLAPFAASMKARLPDVQLEVISTIEYLDLSRRAADLALRFASPVQRDVVTLATLDLEVAAFASPAYARSLPRGYTVRDIAWIAWAPPLDHLSPNPELGRLIRDFTPVFASDDFLVQQRAAQAGLGAIFLGRVEHRFVTGGDLVELDLDLGHIPRSLYLAGARGALDIPRVRAVADLLIAELGRTFAKKKTKKKPR
jgi:DNA-binding transcriptional LysR family regulator